MSSAAFKMNLGDKLCSLLMTFRVKDERAYFDGSLQTRSGGIDFRKLQWKLQMRKAEKYWDIINRFSKKRV